ncbi:MAG: DUF4417 domain-containing protein [Lachnospira sp.]|nr:DUF4417 domain-containing protein [Lachnospira sp.]
MTKKSRKAVIDDGMNPELIIGATLDGIFQIPQMKAPKHIFIPDGITPFSCIDKDSNPKANAVGFNEMDINFSDILINTDECIEQVRPFGAMITPDCSLYRNAPLAVQIANIYRNRAIGYKAQCKGINAIAQIRWGTEETYTTKVFPERIAFLGAPKRSIVAIGTYGCIRGKDNKYHFEAGLESMLIELEPKHVLVYGSMPDKVFEKYLCVTQFHQYDDWITIKKGGK